MVMTAKASMRTAKLQVVFVVLLVLLGISHRVEGGISTLEAEQLEQLKRIKLAELKCRRLLFNVTRPTDGVYCDALFDNLLCWPAFTPAGTVASQPCPDYIYQFNTNEVATRICREDGTWGPPPSDADRDNTTEDQQKGWTNFTRCGLGSSTSPGSPFIPVLIREHIPVVTQISKVGYSISLASLIIATTIMVKFKRLHCQRNVIHINLFVTFMLRAVICLLRDSLLVQGLGLPQDVQYDSSGKIEFKPHGPHWECKLLFTLFYWSLCSNYMWIFVEGLYLHTLIFFAVFDQKAIFKWYIVIGWVTPFCFVIPWVLVRIYHNDTLCWNTHEAGYYWILNGPIVISICMNFFFFLNIIRVLYTKLRASTGDDSHRYRKLAKSTLVLIPLFGVYYIFFIVITNQRLSDPGLEVGLVYAEMTINSFQGMVVAILFCFTNGEVRGELMKRWQRHMLRRQSVVSMRSSRAMSTTSFFLRERASISTAPGRASKFPNVDSCLSLRSMESNGAAGGKSPSLFPMVESSPNLRHAESRGGIEEGRGPRGAATSSSPSSRRMGGPAKSFRFPGVESSPSLKILDSNNGVGAGTRAGEGDSTGLPAKSRVGKDKTDSGPGQRSPVRNGVGGKTGSLACPKVGEREEGSASEAMEHTPMLGNSHL